MTADAITNATIHRPPVYTPAPFRPGAGYALGQAGLVAVGTAGAALALGSGAANAWSVPAIAALEVLRNVLVASSLRGIAAGAVVGVRTAERDAAAAPTARAGLAVLAIGAEALDQRLLPSRRLRSFQDVHTWVRRAFAVAAAALPLGVLVLLSTGHGTWLTSQAAAGVIGLNLTALAVVLVIGDETARRLTKRRWTVVDDAQARLYDTALRGHADALISFAVAANVPVEAAFAAAAPHPEATRPADSAADA